VGLRLFAVIEFAFAGETVPKARGRVPRDLE
jgi:hypothetical protein